MNLSFSFTDSVPPPPPPPVKVTGWRALHFAEGGRRPEPLGSPGVIPPYNPTVKLEMTRDIQLMSYDLMAHFHPAVAADRRKWESAHGWATAMNNGTGYNDPNNPRRDYVTEYPNVVRPTASNPYYDKMMRAFQGGLITGTLNGYSAFSAVMTVLGLVRQGKIRQSLMAMKPVNLLAPNLIWCMPGVDAIDARNFRYVPGTPEAAATLASIIAKRWYVLGTVEWAAYATRLKGHWTPAGWVAYPFILDRPVSFEARFFTWWEADVPPDPLKIYLPV